MYRKPSNIIYGVDENPPLKTTLLLAFQHAVLALVFIVYPLIVVAEGHGTRQETEGIVTASILAIAAGTFLQSLGRKGMGSGYLAVQITNPIYLPVSIIAVHTGGLGLVAGMTLFAGLFTFFFVPFIRYLRPFFPAEVCGVAVLMLGVSLSGPGMMRFTGMNVTSFPDPKAITVAFITFSMIVALSVWPKNQIRLYSAVIGLACGYAAAFFMGLIGTEELNTAFSRGIVALPVIHLTGLRFDLVLLVPFLVTALVATLDNIAGLITCQKINEVELLRPDMARISRGILADSCNTLFSGMLGTIGSGISSAHIALSSATGATSRRVGLWASAMILAMMFISPLARLLSNMPGPISGAVMIYAAAFLITSGIELIVSRMLDIRRIFMIGCSVIVGISSIQFTDFIKNLPMWAFSIVSSPFALSSVCAVVLNFVFSLGTSSRASILIQPTIDSVPEILRFFDDKGAVWGARRHMIHRVQSCVNELMEALILVKAVDAQIEICALFNDFGLDVIVSYSGKPFLLEKKSPSVEELLTDEYAIAKLSGVLVRQYADKVDSDIRDGLQRISLHFDQ
jgi:xanthine permease XanP